MNQWLEKQLGTAQRTSSKWQQVPRKVDRAVKLSFTLKVASKLTLSLDFSWCVGSGKTENETKVRSLIRDPLRKPGATKGQIASS